MTYLTLISRSLIGIVFAAAAFTKLRNGAAFRAFAAWVATLPILPVRGRAAIAVMAAVAEALTIVLVALPWTALAGLAIGATVLAAFTVGTFMTARSQAGAIPCQCFGPTSVPLGLPHAARNALLGAIAAAGALGIGPVATRVPGVALSLGIGAAAALPAIFLDDLIALFAAGRSASGVTHPLPATHMKQAAQPGNGKVPS